MIIDFHTHIFPDELAKKAMGALTQCAADFLAPVHDGTASGLLNNMDAWGIDVSVIQPVVTKPTQTKAVNEWAASLASNRIFPFGGVSPHTDDYKRDIDFVSSLGLKGLKFHSEYQGFVLDEPKMLKMYDYALGKGMIILFHAGFDVGFRPPYKTSPMRFLNILREMQGGVIVAAHLGGCMQWGDVEEFLAGKDIYFDTSMGFEYFSEEQFSRILKKHGVERILFASDAPWSNAKKEIEQIHALPVSDSVKDAILGGNAQRLLFK